MNREEIDRLKEAEKAHLLKVRSLKAQLKDAQRQRGVVDALRAMDTSGLDEEFDRALRDVEQQNVSAEARYEMAVDALDQAADRERARLELERFEAEQRSAAAADLVSRLRAEIESGGTTPPQAAGGSSGEQKAGVDAKENAPDPEDQAKTIGRPRSRPQ